MEQKKFTISEAELVAFKKRRYSRIAVQKALKSGEMNKALCCHQCLKKTELEAHHIDYGQPFVVMWLCSKCHGKAHRKDSPLNPQNNPQSAMPFVGKRYQNVTVSFTMPIHNFIALQKEADRSDKSVSEIVRNQIMGLFPILNPQLELFEEFNDQPQKIVQSRVCRMDKDESLLSKRKYTPISKIRSSRNLNSGGVGNGFPTVYAGHGRDAEKLQRSFAY